MLNATELREGHYYFQVFYVTAKTSVPEIKTLFYLGKNIYKEGKQKNIDEYYFQDSESYQKHGNAVKRKSHLGRMVLFLTENQLSLMYDVHGLVELLHKIRKIRGHIT